MISQPAIFVASMAAVEKLKATEEGAATIAAADVACGLSLGEYTALCFAGAISFEDGVKITKARGEAMQAASEAASSGMVSVIGLKADQVRRCPAWAAARASGVRRVGGWWGGWARWVRVRPAASMVELHLTAMSHLYTSTPLPLYTPAPLSGGGSVQGSSRGDG